jgi:uncharacterized membrane protein YccC
MSRPPSPAALPLARRLPSYLINGLTTALGIGGIQLLLTTLAGAHVALLASSGAVCTSLADRPDTPDRTARRALLAAALGCVVSVLVHAARPEPVLLGLLIAPIAFVSMLMLAWGPRAGSVAFAGVLALVFSMAAPPQPLSLALVGWNLFGAAAYVAWAQFSSRVLQPRYRTLALAATLSGSARLLRTRARVLEAGPDASQARPQAPLQDSIGDEAALAESLQVARDLLFAAPDSPRARRDTAVLLQVLDLRDGLLASRLDLHLLDGDRLGDIARRHLAANLRHMAVALDSAALALRSGEPPPPADGGDHLRTLRAMVFSPSDPRARLVPALVERTQHLVDDTTQVLRLLRDEAVAEPRPAAELQLFVSPAAWPLAALRQHLSSGRSPVLRHAVRSALALSSAYFIALALPWASHPHWLVLSVAVVLRGNLDQTLSRRNARVMGTVLGCVAVLALSPVHSQTALTIAFLAAVAVAHAFLTVRYWVTAAAATVMGLLQSHLVDPHLGFAIAERVADTVLGALLAWAFSYVLPAWERRGIARAIGRTLAALDTYATRALQWAPGAPALLAQRLARREVYEALGALAAAVQRSQAEPERVRLPLAECAALLDHGHRLMAQLSAVRAMLARRSAELPAEEAGVAIEQALLALRRGLQSPPPVAAGAAERNALDGLAALPLQPPQQVRLPWLQRRLQAAVDDAASMGQLAAQLQKR